MNSQTEQDAFEHGREFERARSGLSFLAQKLGDSDAHYIPSEWTYLSARATLDKARRLTERYFPHGCAQMEATLELGTRLINDLRERIGPENISEYDARYAELAKMRETPSP